MPAASRFPDASRQTHASGWVEIRCAAAALVGVLLRTGGDDQLTQCVGKNNGVCDCDCDFE